MKKIKPYLPILSIIIVFIFLGGLAGGYIFASDNTPTIVIGSKSDKVPPIFTENLGAWYPGYYDAKTLKIKNDQKMDVLIKHMGMKIAIFKDGSKIELDNPMGKDYLENMELKIELKDNNLFKKSENRILYHGNFKDFLLGVDPIIKVEEKDDLDLLYTIGMNKNARENIEGIEGKINFIFHIEQDVSLEPGLDSREESCTVICKLLCFHEIPMNK